MNNTTNNDEEKDQNSEPKAKDQKEQNQTQVAKAKEFTPIICPGHLRPVVDLAYSHIVEGDYFLISSCLDGKPMLREGTSGDWIGTFFGHKGAVYCTRLNATATQAVSAAADYTAKIWDAVKGDEVMTLEHKHIVKTAAFSKDGVKVYTGGNEKKLRIFDLNKPQNPQIFEGHTQPISHIVIPPDPNLLISVAQEKCIRVWDLRAQQCVKTLGETSLTEYSSLQLSLDDSVFTCTAGRDVHFYDTNTFELLKSYKFTRDLNCASVHPQSKRFVTASGSEMWVRMYDYESGEELAVNKGHHGPVRCVSFDPFGEHFASGSEDGTIRIWQAKSSIIPSSSKSI